MTTPEHENKLLEFCDTLLRGNDDPRAWERAVGVLRQPHKAYSNSQSQQNRLPCINSAT
ncbi:hypothetical protein [Endozoicomonas sp. 8E]|uniref:hypothetical protein n=1 Tax=Endozoicomonas sp. 8E TaxID=3035692 RepID=UPI002939159D|nr:hypothetical protein [Endozoicomonas sp. 8E]WOG30285.1 hypothetical protein P6910_11770 [Endozoicomonas sp. 8E]